MTETEPKEQRYEPGTCPAQVTIVAVTTWREARHLRGHWLVRCQDALARHFRPHLVVFCANLTGGNYGLLTTILLVA